MKIPCKECILYAICISKEQVMCDDFFAYAVHISPKYNCQNKPPYTMRDYWAHLRTALPKVSRLIPERLQR